MHVCVYVVTQTTLACMKTSLKVLIVGVLLALVGVSTPVAGATVTNLCRGQNTYNCLAFSGYSANTGTWADVRYPGAPNNHNCTRYVAYRLAKGGVPDQGTWGNAGEWINRAPGAKNNSPSVGAIAYWSPSWTASHWGHSLGHVGVVEAVNGDGSVEVTWDSYGDGFAVRQRVSGGDLPTSYIHADDAAIARSGGHTPPPPAGNNPVSNLDSVSSPDAGAVKVRGWTFDRDDVARSLDVHVYIGGEAGQPGVEGHVIKANVAREDVNNAHHVGALHGFDATISTQKVGNQKVCSYAINVGGGTTNPNIGCRQVTIKDPNPFGSYDSVTGGAGQVQVRGWAGDWNVPDQPLDIHVYLGDGNGKAVTKIGALTSNKERSDVNKATGLTGNHGFDGAVKLDATGEVEVCVFILNKGRGWINPPMGCKKATVSPAPLTGSLPDLGSMTSLSS